MLNRSERIAMSKGGWWWEMLWCLGAPCGPLPPPRFSFPRTASKMKCVPYHK